MSEPAVRRVASLARSGISTVPGLLIVVVAALALVAIAVDDTAARIVAVVGLAVSSLFALAVVGRERRVGAGSAPVTDERAEESASEPVLDTDLVGPARTHLLVTAARLGLSAPAPDAAGEASDVFRPLVTVIMPVFNDERYVEAAVESTKRQTHEQWECVIVDDASTDSSLRLIEASIGNDLRFSVIRHELNKGPGAARNRAIAAAKGTYLVFLDGDDLLLREGLADRVAALAAWTGDPYVVGSFCAVRPSPESVTLDELPDRRHATQPRFVDLVIADGESPFFMGGPMVATEVVRGVGGFKESMRSGAVDWDLWYRILRNGYVFVPSRTLGAVYRQRAAGITRGNPAAHTAASASLIRASYGQAEPAILSCPSPYPMPEPLPAYQARITIAERAVRFAAMALVDGDRDGMLATLSVLEPGTWPLLDRHLDRAALVARGASRVLGVRPPDLDPLAGELAPFIAEVEAAVRTASK